MEFDKIRLEGLTTIDLPIFGVLPTDPYLIKAADGLGPPEADVNIAMGALDVGLYQGRRPQGREIVLRIGLNPDYGLQQTVSKLRSDLYGVVTPGTGDGFEFQLLLDDVIQLKTTGVVKRFEIVPFNKDPEVQVTIACMSPYFTSPSLVHIDVESLALPSPDLPSIFNPGNAPSGFYFEVTFMESSKTFMMWDRHGAGVDDQKIFHLYNGLGLFSPGDKLIVDTRPGQRRVAHRMASEPDITYNAISDISPESTWWPILHGGENTLSTPGAAAYNETPASYEWDVFYFQPQYWGV